MSGVGLRSPEHLDLLYQAGLEFNSTLDFEELLPRVFDRVIELLDAEAGSIWLREGDRLVCEIARGPVGEEIEGLELPMGAGIVGDVARRGESELVADAREDPRFVHQVDEATGFATRSMVAVPLRAKGETLGVLQLLNKRSETGQFGERDRALLEGLASTAGLALRNARLHDAERRAKDLKTLLAISREITSTLEVERLAVSAVNLASQALAYDRAAIALDEGGRPVLRAISGRESVADKSESDRELERLMIWLGGREELVYVSDVTEEGDPVARSVRDAFGDYVESTGIRSLCLIPLADEEGRLGVLYFESGTPGFLDGSGREAAELLANQISVATRNADLYEQVPFIGLLEPLAAWRRRVMSMPRRKLLKRVGIPVAVLVTLVVIPWAERITPRETNLLPATRMPVRATVGGLVAEVLVEEGQEVAEGAVLAVLRDDEIRLRMEETAEALAVAQRSAAAARARGQETDVRIAEIEIQELMARQALLRERLERTRLRAPVSGVVLTLRPYERVGEWLTAGATFVVLGRVDRLEIESRVSQADIERVRVGQTIRLKAPSRPDYTFVGSVTEIASHAEPLADRTPAFVVRGALDNERGLLRPGIEARAKIIGSRRPLGYLLLRPFIRWTQLRLWW